jgi:hypothetical protein
MLSTLATTLKTGWKVEFLTSCYITAPQEAFQAVQPKHKGKFDLDDLEAGTGQQA